MRGGGGGPDEEPDESPDESGGDSSRDRSVDKSKRLDFGKSSKKKRKSRKVSMNELRRVLSERRGSRVEPQVAQQPIPSLTPYAQASLPLPIPASGPVAQPTKQQPLIEVKQVVKQTVGAKKRKRKATKGTRQTLAKVKKEYTAAKKAAKKRLTAASKARLAKKLKGVTVKKGRRAAKSKIRAEEKAVLRAALAKLGPVSKKTYSQVEQMVEAAKRLSIN